MLSGIYLTSCWLKKQDRGKVCIPSNFFFLPSRIELHSWEQAISDNPGSGDKSPIYFLNTQCEVIHSWNISVLGWATNSPGWVICSKDEHLCSKISVFFMKLIFGRQNKIGEKQSWNNSNFIIFGSILCSFIGEVTVQRWEMKGERDEELESAITVRGWGTLSETKHFKWISASLDSL